MTSPPNHEERILALEQNALRLPIIEDRLAQVALDAAAARHLGAAVDRDLAELDRKIAVRLDGIDGRLDGLDGKVDANRIAINALGEHTAGGFAQMRGRLDGVAAGLAVIGEAIERIERRGAGEPDG